MYWAQIEFCTCRLKGRSMSKLHIAFIIAYMTTINLMVTVASAQDTDGRLWEQPSAGLIAALEQKKLEASALSATLGEEKYPLAFFSAENNALSASNILHLKLAPDLTENEINDIFIEYNFELDSTTPALGVLTVRTDLSEVFSETRTTSQWLAAAAELIQFYTEDERILSASPEFDLSAQDVNTIDPTGLSTLEAALVLSDLGTGEHEDWGIAQIEAPYLWDLLTVPVQRIVGIFDTGFARHEDIPFVDQIHGDTVQDHGNHVAGIICALHNNNKGFRGVLPYCGVRARVHGFWIDPSQATTAAKRGAQFQSVMETFALMVEDQRQVAAFNVSLGYNWYKLQKLDKNFDFVNDPNLPFIVESQGRFLYTVIGNAHSRNIPIVSAAGNDSGKLDVPFDARLASPFNYAALTSCEARGFCNAIVVEAHDENGDLAVFSNGGGHLSCPGVNIRSAVAKSKTGPSIKSYGVRSGTSMAAPYCTGGLVLLTSLLEDRDVAEIIDCLRASDERNSVGTPMMKLEHAYAQCQ